MAATLFQVGQRWISDTDAALGLGIVAAVQGRRVLIRFPAAQEERTYAVDNAPLSRVVFAPGEEIDSAGQRLKVESWSEHEGLVCYQARDREGVLCTISEQDLSPFLQLNGPRMRLLAYQLDQNRRFDLRVQTQQRLRSLRQSPLAGFFGARVQLLPHQLYIAYQAAQRRAPRLLLADEVGLGKTIEAGLILHQQLLSGRVQRVLILVPQPLLYQWLVELLRRFNLRMTLVDAEHYDAEAGDNPFEQAQRVLCPMDWWVAKPEAQQQALAAGWDLVVIDEAHHLHWSKEAASDAYQAAEGLARAVPGLILLTATPQQLGVAGHYARLRLLDPERYPDLEKFLAEENAYQEVHGLTTQLLGWLEQPVGEKAAQITADLTRVLGADTSLELHHWLAENHSSPLPRAVGEPLLSALLDRHGTGRVMFRNTRAHIQGFPSRRLRSQPLPVSAHLAEKIANWDLAECLYPERALGEDWLAQDPRVAWLTQFLQQSSNKTLVICAHKQSALALERHIRQKTGLALALFHEDMDLVARDRAAAYFAETEAGARALLCSEIGSEGRNFQFAHQLVLFDLPLNPDLLEQRIGRLDRIGQTRDIEIFVPYWQDSAQARLLRWYDEGLNAFAQPSQVGQNLFAALEQKLIPYLLSGHQAEALIEHTRERRSALLQQLQQGRDPLLELNSCRPGVAEHLPAQVEAQEQTQSLLDYLTLASEELGFELDEQGTDCYLLQPSDHMLCTGIADLPDEGVLMTPKRAQALVREDMGFLTWEHPLLSSIMDWVLQGDLGSTAFASVALKPLPPGTLLLEAVFVAGCAAPKALQVERFLPANALRVLLDPTGRDLAKVLTPELLRTRLQPVAIGVAKRMLQQSQQQWQGQLTQALEVATQMQAAMADDALAQMMIHQRQEQERLQALARVNNSIREAEFLLLQQETQALRQHLLQARYHLDAVRIIVCT